MVGCIFQQKQQRSSRSKQELTSMSMLEDGLNDRLQRQFPDYIILWRGQVYPHFQQRCQSKAWLQNALSGADVAQVLSQKNTRFPMTDAFSEAGRQPCWVSPTSSEVPLEEETAWRLVMSCVISHMSYLFLSVRPVFQSSKLLPQWTGLQTSPSTPALHGCFPFFSRLPDSASLGVSHKYYCDVLCSGSICGLLENSWKFVTEM